MQQLRNITVGHLDPYLYKGNNWYPKYIPFLKKIIKEKKSKKDRGQTWIYSHILGMRKKKLVTEAQMLHRGRCLKETTGSKWSHLCKAHITKPTLNT